TGDVPPIERIAIEQNSIQEDEFKITDAMQRESAIADDYWRYTLKYRKKDQMEIALHDIEQKLHDVRQQSDVITHNRSNNSYSYQLSNDVQDSLQLED
ncbi:unnamed protein product, partial [Adineta steineri]